MIRLGARGWRFRPGLDGGLPATVAEAFTREVDLPAQVPGSVYDDLLAAGLLDDPYLGRNEELAAWVGRQDWTYTATLPDLPAGYERIDLVADGLDTAATVSLAGQVVARTHNQHRSYRWDVTGLASAGAALAVGFESAYSYAERVRTEVGEYPASYDQPFNYLRKMASNFGWDWGPTVVTAGIWRDLRFEAWDTARLAAVRPRARLDAATARTGAVHVDVDLERAASGEGVELTVVARLFDPHGAVVASASVPASGDRAGLDLAAGAVELWWPHDLGEQPLYRVEVDLLAGATRLDEAARTVGFRHIALVTTPDQVGLSFGFEVAGKPVFARGYNWIPNDLLVTRTTREHYRARLLDARESGANLIRIWGGGLFETDAFYEVCDELGLMVWQDFPFACAAYPETEDLVAEVEAEARDNVTRIAPHPSLVLWNGCNENLWGYEDWNWKPVLDGRGWGARYYFEVLPRVVAELDPDRQYWAGSPWSGSWDIHPNHPDYGCSHSWVVWNESDYCLYAAHQPRFMAEFGWCGPAAYSTLEAAVGRQHLQPWDPVLMWHFKAQDGQRKLQRAITDGFHEPSGFDDWHYVAQLQQARAVGFGIDHWRSWWPVTQGAVVWQLNDCWPVTSWAAVDSAGIRKPVWYAIRSSFADRLAVVRAEADAYRLVLANQSGQPWEASPVVRRVGLDGTVRASWSQPVLVAPDAVVSLPLPVEVAPAPGEGLQPGRGLAADELLVVDDGEGARRVLALPDHELAYCPSRYDVETVREEAGTRVRVTARSVVRDLLLQADRLGGTAELNLVTLLPGETHEWLVTGVGRALSAEDFASPVLLDAASAELSARLAVATLRQAQGSLAEPA